MEVVQGIHRIAAPLGNRVIYQHLLIGRDRVVIIDTGVKQTPEETILPYLDSLGLSADSITDVIISHADADHMGGNEAIMKLASNGILYAHAADRPLIEQPDRMMTERYDEFAAEGISYPDEVRLALRGMMGEPLAVDKELAGGFEIEIEPGWLVTVQHVPGHSPGHLAVLDPRSGAAIITDAILGEGLPDTEGKIAFAPTYRLTDDYVKTIDKIASWKPKWLLTSHYPLMKDEEVSAFIASSRRYVHALYAAVKDVFKERESFTFVQLMAEVNRRIATWPESANIELAYSLMGALESLERQGHLLPSMGNDGYRWWRPT